MSGVKDKVKESGTAWSGFQKGLDPRSLVLKLLSLLLGMAWSISVAFQLEYVQSKAQS